MLVYHSFKADEGSDDYGTEWDADVNIAFLSRYAFEIKYANYNANDFDTDTEKIIFSLAGKFTQ
jgi:hypothetical protein